MYDNAHFQALVEADAPTGEVVGTDGAIVLVKGLESASTRSSVLFENGYQGMVREASEDGTTILNLSGGDLPMGSLVVLQDPILKIDVGDALVGRIINPLGKPIDGKGPLYLNESRAVFSEAPGVVERQLLSDQLTTGVAMVDMLFPLLRGQRMAILGDSKAGKSAFMTQMAVSQVGTGNLVVYCLIAKRKVDVDAVVARLEETGAMKHSIVVVASIFDSLALSYLAPYTSCAMGEHFWFSGRNCIMIYDDLTSHAKVHRELSLLAKTSPGRESYPGDMFFSHSSLLERAGRVSSGGGTLTALPVVLTPNNDITAFLPTSLISITDGQVVFDLEEFRKGIRPAVSVGLSVSRVGGRGQTMRQKQLTGSLFKKLAEYHQAAEFARFGSDLSADSQNTLALGKRIYEAFKQPPDVIYTILEQELFLTAILKAPPDRTLDVEGCKRMATELAPNIKDDEGVLAAVEQIVEANLAAVEEEAASEEVTV